MKKFLAIVLTFCMLASVICLPAIAAETTDEPTEEPTAGVVLRVSALKKGETTPVVLNDYTSFEDGWNAAMALADNRSEMNDKKYDRVVVDLYADWTAVDGNFTDDSDNGPGFDWDTIYFPAGVRVTLNMNGHTIDRAMTTWEYDGEVMSVDDDVDLIINDGTIKGGWSCNGAGGIHIENDARVTLNNVHIVGNTADSDDGGGIQLIGDSTLVMNGGSFQNNKLVGASGGAYGVSTGAAIYVNDSTATFNDVVFKNNTTSTNNQRGVAIGAIDSQITLNRCTFEGNSYEKSVKYPESSIIYADDSFLTVTDSTFGNNTSNRLFMLDGSVLTMENSVFSNITGTDSLIRAKSSSSLYITNTIFTDNDAHVVSVIGWKSDITEDSFFRNCTVKSSSNYSPFYKIKSPLTFYDCDLGDSSFDELSREYIRIVNSATPDGKIVLRVNTQKKDGTTVAYGEYTVFDDGWNAAMKLATNSDLLKAGNYDRVVVELESNWTADDSQFTDDYDNGPGFNWDAIYFKSGARITLNMNGYTIDRKLTEEEENGEVMCVASDADVIINNGTIKGGYSGNGPGGIQIESDAIVTLNNVNLTNNNVEDDDGAAIAVYGGATLIMNGGSISDNTTYMVDGVVNMYSGAVYISDSTAIFTGVTFKNNNFRSEAAYWVDGTALFCKDSTVTLKDCIVTEHGIDKDKNNVQSMIFADDSKLTIENTDFIGNGATRSDTEQSSDTTAVIRIVESELVMTGGRFTNNDQIFLLSLSEGVATVEGVDFTGNNSLALYVSLLANAPSTFTNCKFSAGSNSFIHTNDFVFRDEQANVNFVDCEFGDATFNNKNAVTFTNCSVSNGVGSLIGEGSLTMIIALLALAAASVSIGMITVSNKKKAAPSDESKE